MSIIFLIYVSSQHERGLKFKFSHSYFILFYLKTRSPDGFSWLAFIKHPQKNEEKNGKKMKVHQYKLLPNY